jgi:hypothetical protein
MTSQSSERILMCCFAFVALVTVNCRDNQRSDRTATSIVKSPEPPQSSTFAITSPRSGSSVDQDIVTVTGAGAVTGATVEIAVFTNDWYAQTGLAQIAADGSWAYSPVYLKGQGPYRSHHNIRARLLKDGQQIAVATVYDVAVR